MTRTELIALAELLAAGTITDSESQRLADFARQIAESQPVAWADCQGEPSKHRVYDYTHPLYTLPLED